LNLKRIVITGGPGTGKTAIINKLKSKGYTCFDEYSRILIRWGYENGIKKIFLEKPNLFTSKIIDGRKKQYNDSKKIEKSKGNLIFFDRGIHDGFAYQNFIDKSFIFPREFSKYHYQKIFILPPWSQIFSNDNERLESFETSKMIDKSINFTYNYYGYKLHSVPKISDQKRMEYILNKSL